MLLPNAPNGLLITVAEYIEKVLVKLHIIKKHQSTLEDLEKQKELIEMMKSKGFTFKEEN